MFGWGVGNGFTANKCSPLLFVWHNLHLSFIFKNGLGLEDITSFSFDFIPVEESDANLTVVNLKVFLSLSSVQFSRSVMSNSLWPHESQHTRPSCPSPTPWVHSNSGPSSRWCHPAVSSSVVPFSSCPQSLPTSESFPLSQLFTWGGQRTRVSASASVLPIA